MYDSDGLRILNNKQCGDLGLIEQVEFTLCDRPQIDLAKLRTLRAVMCPNEPESQTISFRPAA